MIMGRLVQAGEGESRDLVVVYFLAQQNDGALRAAAPGAIIVNDTRADTGRYARVGEGWVQPVGELVRGLEAELGCRVRSVTLCGWSIGCKAVRSQLLATGGRGIGGVVAADGTSASFPTPDEQTQIAPWRSFADRAKRGEVAFVATHTLLIYTEGLPQPYMATVHVLQRATGFSLSAQGPNDAPVLSQEGQLAVWSYAAASAAGHTFQGREALPRCLAQALALVRSKLGPEVAWVDSFGVHESAEEPPATDPSPGSTPPWRDPGRTLGARCVEWLRAQMDAGRGEEPRGSNGGPFVAECLAPCVRGGKRLGLRAANWCAAASCAADVHSRLEGDPPCPHDYRCSGLELEADARASGAWREVADWRGERAVIDPGDIIIFDHGTPKEPWRRHVARFVGWAARIEGRFLTIGGNESDVIRVTEHSINEGAILGFIGLPHRDPSLAQMFEIDLSGGGIDELVERWRRLTGLSDAVMRGEGDDVAAIMARIDERCAGDPHADGKPGE